MLIIQGIEMPEPKRLEVIQNRMGKEMTNAAGKLVTDGGRWRRTLEAAWAASTPADAAQILSAVSDTGFLSVTFPDPATGEPTTIDCIPARVSTRLYPGYDEIVLTLEER